MDVFDMWLSGKKRLTAAEVRKMNPGDTVWFHRCYGKRGEHLFIRATIVQSGNKKQLSFQDYKGFPVLKDIKDGPKVAYTEDNGGCHY